jgi:hypothetical protein
MRVSLALAILGGVYGLNILWSQFTDGCGIAYLFFHSMVSIIMIFYGIKNYFSWSQAHPKLMRILSYIICILLIIAFINQRFM